MDEAGNEGDYTQKTYTLDLTPPKAPELSVESGSFCVKMEFTENEEEDFRCYKIYRREYGDQEYTCIQATIQTEFTHILLFPVHLRSQFHARYLLPLPEIPPERISTPHYPLPEFSM